MHNRAHASVFAPLRRCLAYAWVFFLLVLQGLSPLLHAHTGRDVGPAGVHLYGLTLASAPPETQTALRAAFAPDESPAIVAESSWRQDEGPLLTPATPTAARPMPRAPAATSPALSILRAPPPTQAPGFRRHPPQAPPRLP